MIMTPEVFAQYMEELVEEYKKLHKEHKIVSSYLCENHNKIWCKCVNELIKKR